MNPAEEREFVATNMDSDLQFILGDSGVSLSNMVSVARRFGTLRRFNALADDRAGIRTACLQDFAIPQDTPDNRAQVAAIVTAWETAQEYVAKETEIRAEAKVLGQPRMLQTHERQAMVKAVDHRATRVHHSFIQLLCTDRHHHHLWVPLWGKNLSKVEALQFLHRGLIVGHTWRCGEPNLAPCKVPSSSILLGVGHCRLERSRVIGCLKPRLLSIAGCLAMEMHWKFHLSKFVKEIQ